MKTCGEIYKQGGRNCKMVVSLPSKGLSESLALTTWIRTIT